MCGIFGLLSRRLRCCIIRFMYPIKYTEVLLEDAVKKNVLMVGTMRTLGASLTSGALRTYLISRIKYYEIDTSHFLGQGWNKGKNHIDGTPKKKPEEILIHLNDGSRISAKLLRRALLEIGRQYKCARCNISEWNGNLLRLEIEHINGNPLDNRSKNLCFLCPNCHSQAESYCNATVAKLVTAGA